jgi:hypothetical protein
MCCIPITVKNLLCALTFTAFIALGVCGASTAHATQPVLQRGYDAGVSGANLTETTLNTSNVSPSTFGLVFKLAVDDVIYAQPLYVPNVAIANQGTHNVVYVATMSDTLFAFDADTGVQLWSVNFATSVGATPVPYAQFAFANNRNIVGNLGILSTPVIDPSTNLLYLVACTLENNTMVYRLHAVNITTGAEPTVLAGGTVISASYHGSTFVATHQTQRVSLVLVGNQVVFGFAALEEEASDQGGFAGWLMAYNKATLAQSGAFATVTNGVQGGGVWQSGRPPAVDSSGYVYAFAGNGWTGGAYDGINNFNESALKLNPATGMTLVDWFTPSNWSDLDQSDQDLTSSGPLLIPGTALITGGGKRGLMYLLNTANMGKLQANDAGAVQELQVSPPGDELHGGPVFWQRSTANGGSLLYDWGATDVLKAYPFNGSTIAVTPSSQASGTPSTWPGGILALSANADTPGSGVLWATAVTSGQPQYAPPSLGALYAFDANNVATELWDSTMNSARDNLGLFAKFAPPLVANGRVYAPTWKPAASSVGYVMVYGLLSSYTVSQSTIAFGNQATNVASAPSVVTVTNTGKIALSITGIALSSLSPQPFSQTNTCGSSVAVGASCKISLVFNPTTVGSATATLSVNVGTGVAPQTVALSGTGVAPTFTVLPASVAFGTELTNVATAPTSVTVTNTAVVPVPVTSITLGGANAAAFAQTNDCASSVAVGATCKISVSFDPTSVGSNSATLSVNAGSSPLAVNLSGTGIYAVSLTASSLNVTAGVPVTLTWASAPGAACTASGGTTADNWTGTLGASGTRSVTEASTGSYHYGLNCVANSVTEAATPVAVTVTVPTVTLSASPTSIAVGSPVTLTWTATNATSCVASGGQSGDGWSGTKATSGTASVTPSAAGAVTYTLSCSSGPQSATATAQVTATSASSSSGGGKGGGTLDTLSLLWLLAMFGWRQRHHLHARTVH